MNIQLFFKEHPVYFTIILCHFLVGMFSYWSKLLKHEYSGLKKFIAKKHAVHAITFEIMLELVGVSLLAGIAGFLTVPYLIIEHYRATLPQPQASSLQKPELTTP
ncbi:MAG: hypothetical protein V4686_01530 [Patescibacteria group bacterium]